MEKNDTWKFYNNYSTNLRKKKLLTEATFEYGIFNFLFAHCHVQFFLDKWVFLVENS